MTTARLWWHKRRLIRSGGSAGRCIGRVTSRNSIFIFPGEERGTRARSAETHFYHWPCTHCCLLSRTNIRYFPEYLVQGIEKLWGNVEGFTIRGEGMRDPLEYVNNAFLWWCSSRISAVFFSVMSICHHDARGAHRTLRYRASILLWKFHTLIVYILNNI